MQRCFRNIVAGISLSSVLAGIFFVSPSLNADDLTDAIERVTQTSEGLIGAQKKEKAINSIRNGLQYDNLEALLRQGVTAKKDDIAKLRDHYIETIPDFPKKTRISAEQIRQALEQWVQSLPSQDLKQILEQLKKQAPAFKPVSDEQVTKTRTALDASLTNMTAFLNAGEVEFDWKEQLQWDLLQQELDKDTPNLGRMEVSLNGFYGADVVGLERPEFTNVRTTLRAYMNAVLFNTNPNSKSMYEAQIGNLITALENYTERANNDTAWQVGRIIGWLDRAGQASEVQQQIRYHFYQPNIYLHVSQNLISAGELMEVDETEQLKMNVKGLEVVGEARLRGQISFQIAESQEKATLRVILDGTAISRNVAEKSGVTVVTRGTTTLQATKLVAFDGDGFSTEPAQAQATTKLALDSIKGPSSTHESIAKSKFNKMRSQNEKDASGIAVDSVTAKMDSQVLDLLANVIDGYQDKVRNPLIRRGGFPVNVNSTSTEDYIRLNMLQTGRYQLASSTEPPALNKGTDVALRLHESFIRNFTEVVLGGVELTDEKLVEHMTDLGAEVPEELKTGKGKKSWAITFSNTQPISVSFRDNQLEIAIQGKRFRDGAKVINERIRIAATYNVLKTDEGMQLVREGDVAVQFIGKKSLTVGQVAMKTVMSKKFNAFFKDDIVGKGGISLPGNWASAGNLILQQIVSDNGWLMLSYNLGKGAPAE
ncbi:MAG: hypothetical protein CMJ76_09585 [Planctomycetaceae bacterium]|nr:hypothetical protein [Planctomycetaceae bacterium]